MAAMVIVTVLALVALPSSAAAAIHASAILHGDVGSPGHWVEIADGLGSGCADASYADLVNTTGWGELTVRGSPTCTYLQSAYTMGYLEGSLTWLRIWQAFQNFNRSNSYLVGGGLPAPIRSFVQTQTSWLRANAANASTPYWQHVAALLQQADGMAAGYQATAPADHSLTAEQVYILTLAGDLEDLANIFSRQDRVPEPTEHMDCSALVRLTPDYSELFVGHTTFNAYWCMLRVFKHYIYDVPGLPIAAGTVSFSSRPGDIESKDDFFLLSSGLAVVETSLTIFNKTLYQAVVPESVPVWMRVQLANRMAVDAPGWVSLFSQYNSGTHNNEWIVVDYNLFVPGQPLPPSTVWLVDQLPGFIKSADLTSLLLSQKYIPSYNIPYFPDVLEISGYAKAGYSYANDTRAQIFRRDQGAVQTLDDMCTLMNSNNYKTDPLADGNPCNQISARCDLAGDAFGGIDSKNVDRAHVLAQRVRAIGAPTHAVQPVFVFSHGFMNIAHEGMPDRFDFNWTTMTPAL
eukprot:m.17929 g.17929  ORF g.17929 m.17929 type:complete len:518 (-) comp3290_c0_seq1:566-2119(-)